MSVHEWFEWGALIAWVLAAGGGFLMLAIWLRRGGLRQQGDRQQREGGPLIRPPLIFSHFGLAATGLVLWLIYLATDSSALAWISLVILAVVAVLGFTMFAIWYQRRQREPRAATTTGAPGIPAEQHFPVSIVTLHGLLAVSTVLLVLLAALEIGE
jgi:hypothetical protein